MGESRARCASDHLITCCVQVLYRSQEEGNPEVEVMRERRYEKCDNGQIMTWNS